MIIWSGRTEVRIYYRRKTTEHRGQRKRAYEWVVYKLKEDTRSVTQSVTLIFLIILWGSDISWVSDHSFKLFLYWATSHLHIFHDTVCSNLLDTLHVEPIQCLSKGLHYRFTSDFSARNINWSRRQTSYSTSLYLHPFFLHSLPKKSVGFRYPSINRPRFLSLCSPNINSLKRETFFLSPNYPFPYCARTDVQDLPTVSLVWSLLPRTWFHNCYSSFSSTCQENKKFFFIPTFYIQTPNTSVPTHPQTITSTVQILLCPKTEPVTTSVIMTSGPYVLILDLTQTPG